MTNSGAVAGGKEGIKSSGAEVMSSLRAVMSASLDRNRSNNSKNHTIVMPSVADAANRAQGGECGNEDALTSLESELELGDEIELGAGDDHGKPMNPSIGSKPRLSAAAKRKLKKGMSIDEIQSDAKRQKSAIEFEVGAESYKDQKGYMSYGNENEHAAYAETALQPQSHLRANEAQNANMIEQALLDVIPEDMAELNKKRKLLRWDAKKRKFVKVSKRFHIHVLALCMWLQCS